MRIIIGNIIKTNRLYNMIKKNDHIAVGVSGGKDSLVLLKTLDIYCKKLNKEKHWNLKVKGFLVNLNFKKVSYAKLLKWAKANDLRLQVIDSDVADVLKAKKEKGRIQCSLCSKMKKAILIREMKKQHFNKLALGHHADDFIETFFLNMLNEARAEGLNPNSYLDRNKVWQIRPMILCREKEIARVAKKYVMPIITNLCPNTHNTQRTYMKKFIENNFYKSKQWPNAYVNILRSLIKEKN